MISEQTLNTFTYCFHRVSTKKMKVIPEKQVVTNLNLDFIGRDFQKNRARRLCFKYTARNFLFNFRKSLGIDHMNRYSPNKLKTMAIFTMIVSLLWWSVCSVFSSTSSNPYSITSPNRWAKSNKAWKKNKSKSNNSSIHKMTKKTIIKNLATFISMILSDFVWGSVWLKRSNLRLKPLRGYTEGLLLRCRSLITKFRKGNHWKWFLTMYCATSENWHRFRRWHCPSQCGDSESIFPDTLTNWLPYISSFYLLIPLHSNKYGPFSKRSQFIAINSENTWCGAHFSADEKFKLGTGNEKNVPLQVLNLIECRDSLVSLPNRRLFFKIKIVTIHFKRRKTRRRQEIVC